MDLLTSYPNFKQDILEVFKPLMLNYDLRLIEVYEGLILLLGEKCKIRFTYDRGEVYCQFKQIFEDDFDAGYSVWLVKKHLYPAAELDELSKIYDLKEHLRKYAMIIDGLKNVINGDFSWLPEFTKKRDRENQLSLRVMNLSMDNPIAQKFWSGDPTWIVDAENYFRDSNIEY